MGDTDYASEDETYAVIGAALEVLSQLGHGITGLPLGLIFNFRYAKLQWERLALTR